jgi:hypothetical protein
MPFHNDATTALAVVALEDAQGLFVFKNEIRWIPGCDNFAERAFLFLQAVPPSNRNVCSNGLERTTTSSRDVPHSYNPK